MNEFAILINLLSKKSASFHIGASEGEILKALNVRDKNKSIYFQNLINHLANYLEPLGLKIKYNSLNSFWYLTFDSNTTEIISANIFDGKPRLAASMFYTIVSCFNNSGVTKVQKIREMRKKKGILEDLKELEKMGLLVIEKDTNQVRLTPLIGYLIDLEKLFMKIALKIKSSEN